MVIRALERSLESTTVWNTSTRDAGFYEMTLSWTIWRCFAPQTSSSVLELGLRFPSDGSPWAFETIPPLRYAVGFFLHRNSPRQEIDIEIAGNRPDRLLVNVFYNPGGEGAHFDYGYRGAPSYIELGFDASKASHRFALEWTPCEIRWLVDDHLVHRRAIWDPTPIPHLPMALHVNIWPSRSAQLAGQISNRRLPATTIVGSIALEATSTISPPGLMIYAGQVRPGRFNSSQLTQ